MTKVIIRAQKNNIFINRLYQSLGLDDDVFNMIKMGQIEVDLSAESCSINLKMPNDVQIEEVLKEIGDEIIPEYKVDYQISYYNPDSSLQELLTEYWEDILQKVRVKFSQAIGWLALCRWKLEDEELRVEVKNNLAIDMLNSKKCDLLVSKIIQDNYHKKVKVKFVVGDFSEESKKIDEELAKENDQYMESLIKSFTEREKSTSNQSNNQGNDYNNNYNNNNNYKKSYNKSSKTEEGCWLGRKIKEEARAIEDVLEEENNVILSGEIFEIDIRELKSGRNLVIFSISNGKSSITIKVFENKGDTLSENIKKSHWVKVRGRVQHDKYDQELSMMANDVMPITVAKKEDVAEEKRIELHLHTKMSAMDSVVDAKEVIKRAIEWGHPAIAITDHGVVQAFPDAYNVSRGKDIKVIYGVEAYLVDDGEPIIFNAKDKGIKEETYVVFDLETTGFNPHTNEIIEIGAVKVEGGEIVDLYQTFINPDREIPEKITQLTGIDDDMVKNAPIIEEVIDEFLDFVGESTLVAHNLSFDLSFIDDKLRRCGKEKMKNSAMDTLNLSRALLKDIKSYKLNKLAQYFGKDLENHHRASDDAKVTAEILLELLNLTEAEEVNNLKDVNQLTSSIDYKRIYPHHAVILVKNQIGLKNLYKLVSKSHIETFYKKPRILKSDLISLREGLLVGSACEAGELYKTILQGKDDSEIEKVAKFYDYLEIQPIGNNKFLLEKGEVTSLEELRDINRKIYQLGQKLGKNVVAAGDVHFLDPEDSIYRQILMEGQGFSDAADQAPLYFRTTSEMLQEFEYFGEETARELVIKNPKIIADMIEDVEIIPDKLFTPTIEGADDEIRVMAYKKAKEWYGDPLPELVEKRLERELNSIIGNGYAVIYLTSHKLVKKSLDDGYLVGSRGSVGSSFAATMTGITEVNPLPPHYRCLECKCSEFITDGSVGIGIDLADKDCPNCGIKFIKDGFDIPFEVFLGFKGDKVPDIDLNFSGEYQPEVHKYTEVIFGKEYVYRAGTISTIAQRTAYGFVKGHAEDNNLILRKAEINRLASGCTGVKKTTGQHPGGQIVVPNDKEIYDFTPVQKPANDMKTETLTTHFDFHSIHDNLLKLDILGHDDPTSIRMLQDITGIEPATIPLDDSDTMAIFSSIKPLGISEEDIGIKLGTLGIPEFGTSFVRGMLRETRPTTFAELVRISGLSHGTDVWLNNAQDFIKAGVAELSEVISVRDDIMNYLIQEGIEPSTAFWIMENVRKGKGLTEEYEKLMRENDVPDWYIESCKRIKYMFPKAHASAYVMMAFRIAYFKVHHPQAFYNTYFTIKADDFDAQVVLQGREFVEKVVQELRARGNELSAKDKNTLTVLEIVIEALAREMKFVKVDIYQSKAKEFTITENGLLPPLISLQGLGINAAEKLVESRNDGEFISIEDLSKRAGLSKTVIEAMRNHGCLEGLPETNQLSLFG